MTTGVSASDRVATVRAAATKGALPGDLRNPGHVFPLKARPGGELKRPEHAEAVVDLACLAGLSPCGVLCELTNPDGTMARMPEIQAFSARHGFPVPTSDALPRYRLARENPAN